MPARLFEIDASLFAFIATDVKGVIGGRSAESRGVALGNFD